MRLAPHLENRLSLTREVVAAVRERRVAVLVASIPLLLAGIGDKALGVLVAAAGILPAQLFVISMTTSSALIPSAVAKTRKVRFVWITLGFTLLAISYLVAWRESDALIPSVRMEEDFLRDLFTFSLSGLVLGAIFRDCCARLAFTVVNERDDTLLRLAVVYVWVLAVCTIPLNNRHAEFGPYYVGSLFSGALLQGLYRRNKRAKAKARRRIQNLATALATDKELGVRETEAFREFDRHGASDRLIQQIDTWDEESASENKPLPSTLLLIRCSALRLRGEYERSMSDAKRAIEIASTDDQRTLHLNVLRALNHSELNREDKADERLEELAKTAKGVQCAAVNSTIAVRQAEKILVSVLQGARTTFDNEPLERMNRAIITSSTEMSAGGSAQTVVSRALQVSVPMTTSFMKDAAGTCLLAAGMLGEAKIYFGSCIQDDPDYSGAYLHLGMLYRLLARLNRPRPPSDRPHQWHATICLNTALLLEGNKKSRIRRQAIQQLNELARATP